MRTIRKKNIISKLLHKTFNINNNMERTILSLSDSEIMNYFDSAFKDYAIILIGYIFVLTVMSLIIVIYFHFIS